MLRTLLEERFKLVVVREQRTHDAYALRSRALVGRAAERELSFVYEGVSMTPRAAVLGFSGSLRRNTCANTDSGASGCGWAEIKWLRSRHLEHGQAQVVHRH